MMFRLKGWLPKRVTRAKSYFSSMDREIDALEGKKAKYEQIK